MGADSNVAPVIIRKKKRQSGGHGHHGGAWKVAYADFVTAMMAFFMLMWLLNATTEDQRKGIADYFSPTIPIARVSGGGDGALAGDSVFAEMNRVRTGTGGRRIEAQTPPAPDDGREAPALDAALKALDEALIGQGGESRIPDRLMRHVVTRVTDEGLVIELFSLPDAPLYDPQGPTAALRTLAGIVARASGLVENGVAVEAHVRADPVVLARSRPWEDSADRAQSLRRLLEQGGMSPDRMRRVTGHADRTPAVSDPMAVRNDRFEVIFLRGAPG
jgi:chemotaxis protein MotB